MSIYSSSHPGVILDDTTLTNLGLTETDLRGYFSRDALMNLIQNNPNCVGIRFYNINPSTEFPALLAVCVLANGADMQADGTHGMCAPIDASSNAIDAKTRGGAFQSIKDAYSFNVSESEKFSSFFSREMLSNLFDGTTATHSGLAFYKVLWLGGRSTHLAVNSNLDTKKTIPAEGLNGTGFKNCLSDQPCPGHCANVDANGIEIVSPNPFISQSNSLDGPYIPIWEE